MRDMEKKKKYDIQYTKEKYDQLRVFASKADGQRIRAAAAAAGQSVNAFVLGCVWRVIGAGEDTDESGRG